MIGVYLDRGYVGVTVGWKPLTLRYYLELTVGVEGFKAIYAHRFRVLLPRKIWGFLLNTFL